MNAHTKSRSPNIVLITADQWRGDCLGFLHSRHPVMTPHLNQLAAEGVAFSNTYADCPVCMPQRVTFLTGQCAYRFGLTGNFPNRTPIDACSSLPALLSKNAGYQTQAIGKMHFNPARSRMGFEHVTLHPDDYVNWLETTEYAGLYRGHGLGGNEVYPVLSAVPERFTHTHWIVDRAVEFLGQRDPDCPFFLWIVFEAPHSPFDPPEEFLRLYDHISIPDPIAGSWSNTPREPVEFRTRRLANKFDHLSREMVLQARRHYYAQVSHIDYQLARFFGELKRREIYDQTAIVFTSDHGEHLGDHAMFAKSDFLHGAGDVPLIIKLPAAERIAHPSRVLDGPALTADIFPTLLELADIPNPPACDGTSLLNCLRSGNEETERTIYGECGMSAFAMNARFKFIFYAQNGIQQLFDVQKDRENVHDLAADPQFNAICDQMRRDLCAHLAKFDRPMIKDGEFAVRSVGTLDLNPESLRSRNPAAWRGPLRYGQGY